MSFSNLNFIAIDAEQDGRVKRIVSNTDFPKSLPKVNKEQKILCGK